MCRVFVLYSLCGAHRSKIHTELWFWPWHSGIYLPICRSFFPQQLCFFAICCGADNGAWHASWCSANKTSSLPAKVFFMMTPKKEKRQPKYNWRALLQVLLRLRRAAEEQNEKSAFKEAAKKEKKNQKPTKQRAFPGRCDAVP